MASKVWIDGGRVPRILDGGDSMKKIQRPENTDLQGITGLKKRVFRSYTPNFRTFDTVFKIGIFHMHIRYQNPFENVKVQQHRATLPPGHNQLRLSNSCPLHREHLLSNSLGTCTQSRYLFSHCVHLSSTLCVEDAE